MKSSIAPKPEKRKNRNLQKSSKEKSPNVIIKPNNSKKNNKKTAPKYTPSSEISLSKPRNKSNRKRPSDSRPTMKFFPTSNKLATKSAIDHQYTITTSITHSNDIKILTTHIVLQTLE